MTQTSTSLNLQPHLNQIQRLIMLPEMQQAIHIMQMPVMELQSLIENQLEQNPVIETIDFNDDFAIEQLEDANAEDQEEMETPVENELTFDEHDFDILRQLDQDVKENLYEEYTPRTLDSEKQQTYMEQSITAASSLFEHLMLQAHETFENPSDLKAAELIVGNFDEWGFLQTSLKEMSLLHHISEQQLKNVLVKIQEFEPYGIGAANLQESLLIQLRCLGKENTLAMQIIQLHYDDLLHNRIPLIQQSLHSTKDAIGHAIAEDIAHLDLRPGALYSQQITQNIQPDVVLRREGEGFAIGVNDDFLPAFKVNERYMKLLRENTLPSDEKHYIQNHINAARWLLKNVVQRNNTLKRIAEYLVNKQKSFFASPEGQLTPMTMKIVADALDLHESTVARAVANKYIACDRGVLSLKSFFNIAYATESGCEIASTTVLEHLKTLITNENKAHPLSDEALSVALKSQGIPCARRTVAKYRNELNIGNTQQRRQWT